jgi:hypothetical protein
MPVNFSHSHADKDGNIIEEARLRQALRCRVMRRSTKLL